MGEFSRRKFLVTAGAAAGALVLMGGEWLKPAQVALFFGEKGEVGMDQLLEILEKYAILDALESARSEGITLAPNPERRDMMDIIQEGIALFQNNHPDQTVTYDFHPMRQTDSYYLEQFSQNEHARVLKEVSLNQAVSFMSGAPVPQEVEEAGWSIQYDLMDASPPLIWAALHASFHNFLNPEMLLIPGSGFHERLKTALLEQGFDESLIHYRTTMRSSSADPELPPGFSATISRTTQETIEGFQHRIDGRTVTTSTSELLEYYLELNRGVLNRSIIDTAIDTKLRARNIFSESEFRFAGTEENAYQLLSERFRPLKDEFSQIGSHFGLDLPISHWDSSKKAVSRINWVGIIYHNWLEAGMIHYLPPYTEKTAVCVKQLNSFQDQGGIKIASDFSLLRKLRKLESYFRLFPPSTQ